MFANVVDLVTDKVLDIFIAPVTCNVFANVVALWTLNVFANVVDLVTDKVLDIFVAVTCNVFVSVIIFTWKLFLITVDNETVISLNDRMIAQCIRNFVVYLLVMY